MEQSENSNKQKTGYFFRSGAVIVRVMFAWLTTQPSASAHTMRRLFGRIAAPRFDDGAPFQPAAGPGSDDVTLQRRQDSEQRFLWWMMNSAKLWTWIVAFRVVTAVFVNSTANDPDEFFQSIEVAHQFVFGTGELTWEWRHGIRSFIYPAPFALCSGSGRSQHSTLRGS